MKTGRQTTYILLERGDEDRRLYEEIDLIAKEAPNGRRGFYEKFPMLTALRSGLRDEMTPEEAE